MADLQSFSEADYQEILEYLRRKVREFGFSEADDAIGDSITSTETSDAVREYIKRLIEYLQIFSNISIADTEKMFGKVFDSKIEVPFWVAIDSPEQLESSRRINLKDYQHCGELVSHLKKILEDLGPSNTPQSFPRQRPGRKP